MYQKNLVRKGLICPYDSILFYKKAVLSPSEAVCCFYRGLLSQCFPHAFSTKLSFWFMSYLVYPAGLMLQRQGYAPPRGVIKVIAQ